MVNLHENNLKLDSASDNAKIPRSEITQSKTRYIFVPNTKFIDPEILFDFSHIFIVRKISTILTTFKEEKVAAFCE